MESAGQTYKCACSYCGVRLEYPVEIDGTSIECPHCNQSTLLTIGQPDLPPEEAGAKLDLETVLGAFRGGVKWQRTSLLYTLALLLVTATIVILPLIYIGLLGAAGYGVYWWATRFSFLLGGTSFGFYVLAAKWMLYFSGLLVGGIVFFFMVKPLLARRLPHAQPLALNPGSEPLLFAFITQICKTIGAPFPRRIDVDCEMNASASFRRGFKSLLGDDLVLTLGLPLVAGCTVTQLAGIIAHEFGHFTQGFAMRLNYINRRVNGWFARVIYQRDQWDVMLEEMATNEEDWRVQLVVAVARLGVWFSRLILKGLMAIGLGISAFVSRQMEYDADRYKIDFVGSRIFEEVIIRLGVLSVLSNSAYKHLRIAWNANGALPESIPAFLQLHDGRLPDDLRTEIADRVGLAQTNIFSTHPATGDRIRCARRAAKEGVFALDAPATDLFENFDVLSRQVTLLHYTEDLGLELPTIKLRPAESFFENLKEEPEAAPDPNVAIMEEKLGPPKLSLRRSQASAE